MGFVQRDDIRIQVSEELGKIKPVQKSWLLLLLDEIVEDESEGGILMPTKLTADLAYREATVIATGDGVRGLSVDDRVVFGKFHGKEIPHSQSKVCKLVIVSEDQVDAVME